MNKGVHLAMRLYIITQLFMTGFKEHFVCIGVHERAGRHPQVIAKTDNIHDIAHRSTDLFQG